MKQKTIILKSQFDNSVNSVMGPFETRFISREEGEEVIIYLSSFGGCDMACRMCWLTQTKQNDMTPAGLEDFLAQATRSLSEAAEYHSNTDARKPLRVHFNFMARGEPLLNPVIREDWGTLSEGLMSLGKAAFPDAQEIKFKISTIMTGIYEYDQHGTVVGGWNSLPFKVNKPEIYYSLYSMDPEFRKRWLPRAESPHEMLRILATYQLEGGKVRVHGAFILGHNDDLVDVNVMINSLKFFGLAKKFNIVRFNTPDADRWEETSEDQLNAIKLFMESKGIEVQMVPRVGYDVRCSCGTFVTSDEVQRASEMEIAPLSESD